MPRDLALLCPAESMEPWLLENGPKHTGLRVGSPSSSTPKTPTGALLNWPFIPERDEAKPLQVESARWFPITGVSHSLWKGRKGIGRQGIRYPRSTPGLSLPTAPFRSVRTGGWTRLPGYTRAGLQHVGRSFQEPGTRQLGTACLTPARSFRGSSLRNVHHIVLNAPSYGSDSGRIGEPLPGDGWPIPVGASGSRDPEWTHRGSPGLCVTVKTTFGSETLTASRRQVRRLAMGLTVPSLSGVMAAVRWPMPGPRPIVTKGSILCESHSKALAASCCSLRYSPPCPSR